MKIYKDRQTTYRQLVDLVCDLCGKSAYGECDEFECTIRMKDRPLGAELPDEERSYDVCRDCWETRLRLWIVNEFRNAVRLKEV